MNITKMFSDKERTLVNIPESTDIKQNESIYLNCKQSIIIVGANGSGKSRFCKKIEDNNSEMVHRITAQKDIALHLNYELKSYDSVFHEVFYGTDDVRKFDKGYKNGFLDDSFVKPANDATQVFKLLFAQHNRDSEVRSKQAAKSHENGKSVEVLGNSVVEDLIEIWNQILPNRKLNIEDLQISAENNGENYSGMYMSDGERDILYYLAVCLCMQKNKFVIIDEPENHIHNSIISKLFRLIQDKRTDLGFIFVTHNLDFAATHPNAVKLWFKDYLGNEKWDYARLDNSEDLPEELLIEVLGSKQNILFVEGEKSSLDTKLYQAYYTNYKVIGCGGCQKVIQLVKAFNSDKLITMYSVQGIIDRDYKTDQEIRALEAEKVFVISVAEVENLFIIKKLIEYAAKKMYREDSIDSCIDKIVTKFISSINLQKATAIEAEVKYQFAKLSINKRDVAKIKQTISNLATEINYDDILSKTNLKFDKNWTSANYAEILMICNQKGLINQFVCDLGFNDKEAYYNNIIGDLLQEKDESGLLHQALSEVLPRVQ